MTVLTRWEPFREFSTLQDRMNRLFRDTYGDREEALTTSTFAPPVDVYEDEHNITLKIEVPGIDEQDIDLDAVKASGRLTIVGWTGATFADAIADWERLFGKALAGGPTVLRIVGEMACERAMFGSDADMMAYEEAYELMSRRYPAVTLCQYDAREFAGYIVLRALKSHPDMFVRHLGGFLN